MKLRIWLIPWNFIVDEIAGLFFHGEPYSRGEGAKLSPGRGKGWAKGLPFLFLREKPLDSRPELTFPLFFGIFKKREGIACFPRMILLHTRPDNRRGLCGAAF